MADVAALNLFGQQLVPVVRAMIAQELGSFSERLVAIEARKEAVGKLYNVAEFAAEVAQAAVDPVPADNTRLVGDVGYFTEYAAGE